VSSNRQLIGSFSTEGGPVLVGDWRVVRTWSGIESGDYDRLLDILRPGDPVRLIGMADAPIAAWQVGTGSMKAYRTDAGIDLVTYGGVHFRVEIEADWLLRLTSGWLVAMWAAEDARPLAARTPREGSFDLSIAGAGVATEIRPGLYALSQKPARPPSDDLDALILRYVSPP
jgi:hypothetical protein